MATYNEPMRPYEFVLSDHGGISYEQITLNSGAGTLVPGSVIGRITKRQAAAPIPAVAGGSGNGTMTLLTFGPDVQIGDYVIQCITAVAHGGVFSVTAPDGTALPNFTMGTTTGGTARYTSSHLSFSLTDDADFITANSFTVTVTAGGTPTVVGGTGNGVMSAITLGKAAQLGTYTAICRVAISDSGDFEVMAPDGSSIGRFIMGTTSGQTATFKSDHVNFTISDGSGNYIVGNYFNIIVAGYAAPEGLLWDPTAVNGVQDAYGIVTHSAAASAKVTVLTRLAEIKQAALTFKTTVTAAQKAEAYRHLAANQIIVRS
jgi:hypothetical protein